MLKRVTGWEALSVAVEFPKVFCSCELLTYRRLLVLKLLLTAAEACLENNKGFSLSNEKDEISIIFEDNWNQPHYKYNFQFSILNIIHSFLCLNYSKILQ